MDLGASELEQRDERNSREESSTGGNFSKDQHSGEHIVAIPWAQIRRHFPEYQVSRVTPALQPIYKLRLVVEAIERKPLPTMALYVLKAIALGAGTAPKVAHLLGLDERDLAVAAVDLLKRDLIEQQAMEYVEGQAVGRRLLVTRLGQEALKGPDALPSPKTTSCYLGYNCVIGEIMSWDEAWSPAQAAREGFFILPDLNSKPALVDLSVEEVSQAVHGIHSLESAEITGLLELRPPQRYYRPVLLILLQRANERRVVLFRGVTYLPAESTALQHRYLAHEFDLPADAEDLTPVPVLLPRGSSPALRSLAARVQEDSKRIQHLEGQLTQFLSGESIVDAEAHLDMQQVPTKEMLASEPASDNPHEPQRQEQQGQRLLALDAQLRLAREEAQQLRSQLAQHRIQLLRTEEHRPLLERALRDAKRELFIISPWMNRRTCNDTLCELIASALRRGVRVIIGYSIGENTRNPQDAERQEANAWSVLNALSRRLNPPWSERLEVYRTRGTHQKILLQDDELGVNSSFNWLSYLGERDSEYRSETGTLLRSPEDLTLLRAEIMETLRDAERITLRSSVSR